ncbi:MAG TPA: hypothetical protein VHL79_03410, partial [Ramlibacter sp.]|nr:hypothetical protein [Ramlibacter sp.]
MVKKKLIWVGPEFTPYHEFFLDCVAKDPRFDLHVEMMDGPSKTHPFKLGAKKPYSWRIGSHLEPGAASVIERVLSESEAAVVVASYVHPTLLKVMRALAQHGRSYIYFTDTPLPNCERWQGDAMEKRSLPRRIGRRLLLRWIFAHARSVFATGKVGVEAVVKLGCPVEKAVVFPFFVPLPDYDAAAKQGPTVRFASVGQLIERKG